MADAPAFDKFKSAWTLPWEDGWVTAVSFIGSTRRLAAGNQHGKILVWDLPEKADGPAPAPVRRLDGHTNEVTRLLSTPDGRYLISASYDHSIRIWDMEAAATGSDTVIIDARARAAEAKKLGAKAPPAAPGVKVEVQQAERTLTGHKDWVQGLSLSQDGKTLVSGDDGANVVVWDLPAGKEVRRWKLKGWAYAVALAPDAQRLLVSERIPLVFTPADQRSAVMLWDPNTGQMVKDLTAGFKMYISAAAFSPDGKLLALAKGGETDKGTIFLLEADSGKKVRELTGHQYGTTDVRFTADGTQLLTSGRDTTVRVWKVADGKQVVELGKPRGGQFKDWIHALALSEDQRWIAGADMAGQVQVWAAG